MSWRLRATPSGTASSPAGGSAAAAAVTDKRSKTTKAADPDEGNVANLAGKGVLQVFSRLRATEAALFMNFLVPRESPVCVALTTAGKQYAAATEAAGPEHELGSPHTHKAAAMLDALASMKLEEKSPDLHNCALAVKKLQELAVA